MNNIYLRRKNKVIVNTIGPKATKAQLATINANIESLGYVLHTSVMNELRKEHLDEFHKELVNTLSEMKGVRNYKPIYPNFPTQVMEMEESELYLNAMVQYFHDWVADVTGDSSFIWAPSYEKITRNKLKDKVKLTVIILGTLAEFTKMMDGLISSNTSISDTDKKDITWYLSNNGFKLPEKIPHKEILAFVGGMAIDKGIDVSNNFKTATDVLRLAVAMSGGDVSLAENTKFRNFKRSERRGLLSMLENCGEINEDMVRHYGKWLRLGEKLHPGERKDLKKVTVGFNTIRDKKLFYSFETYNFTTENLISIGDASVVEHLKKRPGMYARRLDELLRKVDAKSTILKGFNAIATKVSTPVLLQTRAHFLGRDLSDLRVFFPKGNLAKAQAIKNELTRIPTGSGNDIVKICDSALIERFAKLPKLGTCRIDDSLKECLVPFSQRSASKSLRTIVRGSKLPFGKGGDTVRFFIWWKEGDDRADLDLSAVFYKEDWTVGSYITYYNLKDSVFKACHSGDKTSAPNGACEFIDIDIPSCLKHGGRYVVMSVNSFTRQKFSDLPECFAGWMLRQEPKSGEIFEPKTVLDKLDVTSQTTAVVPMILDLQECKVIWADTGLKVGHRRSNNIHSNLDNIGLFGKAFTQLTKPNLYDLFTLHVKARGKVAKEGDKVQKVYDLEDAFEIEKIMSEYLK